MKFRLKQSSLWWWELFTRAACADRCLNVSQWIIKRILLNWEISAVCFQTGKMRRKPAAESLAFTSCNVIHCCCEKKKHLPSYYVCFPATVPMRRAAWKPWTTRRRQSLSFPSGGRDLGTERAWSNTVREKKHQLAVLMTQWRYGCLPVPQQCKEAGRRNRHLASWSEKREFEPF